MTLHVLVNQNCSFVTSVMHTSLLCPFETTNSLPIAMKSLGCERITLITPYFGNGQLIKMDHNLGISKKNF